MAKLVVLKLDGDFAQQGFRVTLEIGEEEAHPSTAITGLLPPASELVTCYEYWISDLYYLFGLFGVKFFGFGAGRW